MQATADRLKGKTVYASDGEKLGTIDDVLVDRGGQPRYVQIKSGWFGTKRHSLPIEGLQETDGDDLTTRYTSEQLRSAPVHDDDLDYDREREIGAHYGHSVDDWRDEDAFEEEDLTRGPTPETRHPHGGADLPRDITEGPTPETRRADRMAEEGRGAAAGQPDIDRGTRMGESRMADDDITRERESTWSGTDTGPIGSESGAMGSGSDTSVGTAGTGTIGSSGPGRRIRLRRWDADRDRI